MASGLPMLTGYRVLDFTGTVAGPVCTRVLADMGAEVIKVELPPRGDRTRGDSGSYHPLDSDFYNCTTTQFIQHNRYKKGLAINYKTPRGHELIMGLVAKCDVVVENFSPGVMARAGLSYEALRAVNPRIIMCSISLAGQSGPLGDKPGVDFIAQAYGGFTYMGGEIDRGPISNPVAIGDVSTGMAGAMAICAALLHRENTGEGQWLEAALIDTYVHAHETNIPKVSINPTFVPKRNGALNPRGSAGIFHFSDEQWLFVMVPPHKWEAFVKIVGRPELLHDPRLETPEARRDHQAEFKQVVEQWLQAMPSREAALAALESERVLCGPVLSLNETINHPHMRQRGSVRRVKDPLVGEMDVAGLPVKFSRWPQRPDAPAPLLGEHNEPVLQELLGLSEEQIAALYQEQVLVRDPLAGAAPAIVGANFVPGRF